MDILGAYEYAKKFLSTTEQAKQMLDLYKRNKLLPAEYYLFNCFEKSALARDAYIGVVESKRIWEKANANGLPMTELVEDKLRLEIFLRKHGVNTVESVAVDLDSIQGWSSLPYPLISKPRFGYGGKGVHRLLDFHDMLRHNHAATNESTVFQKFVKIHPKLRALYSKSTDLAPLATIRMLTVRDRGQVKLVGAVFKMPVGRAVADNMSDPDNYMTAIDIDTGRFLSTYRSPFAYTAGKYELVMPYSYLPGIEEYIRGKTIPFWHEAVATTLYTHSLLPDNHLLGTDVAITEEGPLVVETNCYPGLTMLQIAYRKGLRHALRV